MVSRVLIVVCIAVVGGIALGACSYTEKDDAPVPSRVTNPLTPTSGRVSVVGTLPPVSAAPVTTVATTPPTEAPTTTSAPPPTAPKPTAPRTTPTAPQATGPVSVQAGAYTTPDAAALAVTTLAGKGFGGFAVSGDGPFRVVRGGLSGTDAEALVRSLGDAGVAAFIRA